MYRMKVYRTGREVLVAVADADIVGRTFREGRLRLEVSEAFYGSDPADAGEILQHLRLCTVANLVGSSVVDLAVANGFVDADQVLLVEGIPHAQVARLAEG